MRWVLVCALLCLSLPARADTPEPFAINLRVEIPLAAGVGVLWMMSEVLKPQLAPEHCRLCGRNRLDEAVQSGLMWENINPPRRLSDALFFGIVPAFSLASAVSLGLRNGDGRTALEDTVVLAESVLLASALTQITKYSAGRERPFLRTQRDNGEMVTSGPDDNLSFYSGHTSQTFAAVVGAGAIASFRGYRQAPWIWGIGVPLAALTGYLRIASDRHYFTDVLTGALVGSAIGVLVPWLHAHYGRRSDGTGATVGAAAPGVVTFTWMN